MIIINKSLHCSSPYKFLTWLCNSYPLRPCLTKCTCWWYRWQHQLDVRISWWFSERLHYCGELCSPLSLDWRVLGGTAMVRGAANYTSPHIGTLLAGVEGGIRRENSLGGYPSSGLWGFESNLSAAWGCTYRQCRGYVSLGGSVHYNMGTTQPKCIDLRSGWAGK